MRQGHKGCGAHLTPTESVGLLIIRYRRGDAVDQPCTHRRNKSRHNRGHHGGNYDLGNNAFPLHTIEPHSGERGTDQTAEKSVGRTGGKPKKPGQHIPKNTAYKTGKDDQHKIGTVGTDINPVKVYQPFTDGFSNLNG